MTPLPEDPSGLPPSGTHRLALERLAAVDQYLYDYMNGDGGERDTPDPLPALAMESVRVAQAALTKAIKDGQRISRETLGGEIVLRETDRPRERTGVDADPKLPWWHGGTAPTRPEEAP